MGWILVILMSQGFVVVGKEMSGMGLDVVGGGVGTDIKWDL